MASNNYVCNMTSQGPLNLMRLQVKIIMIQGQHKLTRSYKYGKLQQMDFCKANISSQAHKVIHKLYSPFIQGYRAYKLTSSQAHKLTSSQGQHKLTSSHKLIRSYIRSIAL